MKILLAALVFASGSAMAWESEFQRRSDAEMEAMEQRSREIENQQFLSAAGKTCDQLAAINNTTCSFDPDVRTEPDAIGEDAVAGEYRLGNGGVCVAGVWSGNVYCNGAQGIYPKAKHGKKTRR